MPMVVWKLAWEIRGNVGSVSSGTYNKTGQEPIGVSSVARNAGHLLERGTHLSSTNRKSKHSLPTPLSPTNNNFMILSKDLAGALADMFDQVVP